MGGLTALVWLPDEVIAYENTGFTAGFRRLNPSALDDPALAGPSLGDPGSGGRLAGTPAQSGSPLAGPGLPGRHANTPEFAGDPQAADHQGAAGDQEPDGGWAGEPSEAVQALAATRVPRFAEGIPGSSPAASDPATDTAAPVMGAPVGVIVPPAASPPAASAPVENRLPIFESVESDWFRRSRRNSDAPDSDTTTEAWSSPADEGWQAAEVVDAPVSSGLTAAGLPQRVPKANLVPGRAGLAGAASQPVQQRSAAQTQARLASFQRAVREARAAAQTGDAEQGDEAAQGEEGNDQAD
jgi:hypothetical protein